MTDKVTILTRQKEILVSVLEQQPTVFDEILASDYPEYESLEKQLLGVVTEELPADTDPGPVPGEEMGESSPTAQDAEQSGTTSQDSAEDAVPF